MFLTNSASFFVIARFPYDQMKSKIHTVQYKILLTFLTESSNNLSGKHVFDSRILSFVHIDAILIN